jgi:hypothetical protein
MPALAQCFNSDLNTKQPSWDASFIVDFLKDAERPCGQNFVRFAPHLAWVIFISRDSSDATLIPIVRLLMFLFIFVTQAFQELPVKIRGWYATTLTGQYTDPEPPNSTLKISTPTSVLILSMPLAD